MLLSESSIFPEIVIDPAAKQRSFPAVASCVGAGCPPDESAAPAQVAALLPALDPTPMGWQARDWYLGPHGAALFDRTGNIGPTVWYQGRIVGGWARRADGEIVYRLLEKLGREATQAVAREAETLGDC